MCVNDPFEMASSVKTSPMQQSQSTAAEDEAAREKLRSMGNRKAISSDDFFNEEKKSAEMESKF
jgi:hypothetical protein